MAEESIEHHNSAEKDVQEIATNDEEGFTDCDDANADENEDGKFAHSLLITIYDYSSL